PTDPSLLTDRSAHCALPSFPTRRSSDLRPRPPGDGDPPGASMGRSTREQPVHPERSGAPTLILALACAAQLMVVLDVSVINVALPAIHTDLTVTPESVQWV